MNTERVRPKVDKPSNNKLQEVKSGSLKEENYLHLAIFSRPC